MSTPDMPTHTLTKESVHEVLSSRFGVPQSLFDTEKAERDLEQLEEQLLGELIGQDESLQQIVETIHHPLLLEPVDRRKGPLVAILLLGPSGVGKTETARLIAQSLFEGPDQHLVHIHGGDFQEKHSVHSLVGAPPSYVGYKEGGQLVDQLRQKRAGVLLLDEVTKMHPTILTEHLLPLLEEGTVRDLSSQETVSAENFVILLTSNLGTNSDSLDRANSEAEIKSRLRSELRSQMPKEFLGRLDQTIVFSPLDMDSIREIWRLNTLPEVEKRLQSLGDFEINISSEAEEILLRRIESRVPEEGARALRDVQRQVESRVRKVVVRETAENDDSLIVRVRRTEDGGVRFRAVSPAESDTSH